MKVYRVRQNFGASFDQHWVHVLGLSWEVKPDRTSGKPREYIFRTLSRRSELYCFHKTFVVSSGGRCVSVLVRGVSSCMMVGKSVIFDGDVRFASAVVQLPTLTTSTPHMSVSSYERITIRFFAGGVRD